MYEGSKLIGARVTPELHDLVVKVSRNRGEDVSSFLRRLLLQELARLSYLSEEQKKALGIVTPQPEVVPA